MLDTLQKDFVGYEARKGSAQRALIWKYVLRNSVVAATTQIGLLFGGTIAGAVVVETIFDWPGIGFYTVQAILTADYKVMLAVTLLIGVIYALVNILVDVVHGLIDPRLREQGLSAMLVLAKFAKDKPAVLGAAIVLLIAIVAILAPLLAPYPGDVAASHLLRRLKPPSWDHPFGTDNLGRDIFSRVILGARGALTIALMVVGISMVIGVPLGLIAGYYQGWGSEAIMRVTDVFLAVPQLILALALAQLMGPSLDQRHAGPHR